MNEKLRKQAEDVFKRHDINNSNYIEINELKNIFDEISTEYSLPRATEDEIQDILNQIDSNSDKKLSMNEFIELYGILLEMKNSN
jgi:Ca2+-binding EF-hand superfamily protein